MQECYRICDCVQRVQHQQESEDIAFDREQIKFFI